MNKLAGVAILLLSASPLIAAPRPASGKVVISNTSSAITAWRVNGRARQTVVSLKASRPAATRSARPVRSMPGQFAAIVEEAARVHRVDSRLIAAVARQESAWNPRAVSPVGAKGLMQLMPATARALGVRDAFDARQNIFGGARYLRELLDDFDGNLDLTLAAYNAGPGNVAKYGGVPPFRETRNYVAKIRASLQ